MNATERYERLLGRRAPNDDRLYRRYAEGFEFERGSAIKFLLGAMKAVDQTYTSRLKGEGDRVEHQIVTRLEDEYPGLACRRQGSVSNNTHIRYYSDVDVLSIIDKYFSLEPPQKAASPYSGDPVDDLSTLRQNCLQKLERAFPAVDFDDSGSTAIAMSGGSLICKVDVVPANWYNTNAFATSGAERDRGVQVLDRSTGKRNANYPFLHNYRINQLDHNYAGVPKMLMRLLKTVRSDLEETEGNPGCSSYDLCSLVYRMPPQFLVVQLNRPLDIIENLLVWLRATLESEELQSSLKVVDDTRVIYKDETVKNGVSRVRSTLAEIHAEAERELGGLALISESHVA